MKAFAAEMIFTDPLEGNSAAIVEARRIYSENPGLYFKPDQYDNPHNSLAHFETTEPEIWSDSGARVTHFIAATGTSGTLTGTGRYLKSQNSDIRVSAEGCRFMEMRHVEHCCLSNHASQTAMPLILEPIRDCHAVFIAKIGDGPAEKLAAIGVSPVSGYAYEAIETSLQDYLGRKTKLNRRRFRPGKALLQSNLSMPTKHA